jgi:hypothetical protein
MSDIAPRFGDHVRIRRTPLTANLGLAGLLGTVSGETTPSVTGVEVIGDVVDDYAINVVIEERKEGFWFGAALIEFVDHAEGTQIEIGSRHFVRDPDGEWIETPGKHPPLKRGFISWLLGPIFRGRR